MSRDFLKMKKISQNFFLIILKYVSILFKSKLWCKESEIVKKQKIIRQFFIKTGYYPNINNPKSFNEKIQWLKLHYQDPLLTQCVDKYKVREYVKEKIGEEYLIKLLNTYDDVEQINFDKLPNRFVLKVNHAAGQNIICKNKNNFNWQESREQLKNWMKPSSNHYFYSYEWGYKNIKTKIICEEYIEQVDGKLLDYKILCFHGKPEYIWVDIDRFNNHRRNFYDLDWNYLDDMELKYPKDSSIKIPKPENLKKVKELARKLSKDFLHVRVDLYIIDEKIYFGELTFYSESGMGQFKPVKWDYKFGELLELKGFLDVKK